MTCPKCGSSLKCIGGESAHPDNWYCIQEQRCGWKAWDPVMRGTTDHTIAKLESEVIRLGTKSTRIKSLEAKVEGLKRELKIANTFAVSRRKVITDLQAKVERYRKCLQRIVDEGWDRYGCAEALKQKGE